MGATDTKENNAQRGLVLYRRRSVVSSSQASNGYESITKIVTAVSLWQYVAITDEIEDKS